MVKGRKGAEWYYKVRQTGSKPQKNRTPRESAAHGFEASLRRARPAPDPEPARRFAQAEHEKRGLRWGTGRGVGYTHSQAGFEAGSAIPVAKAVGGRPPRGLLGG